MTGLVAGPFFHATRAALAVGDVEDDPNVTDKQFPGNPTQSCRTDVGVGVGVDRVSPRTWAAAQVWWRWR